jgi:hypothetical protein
LYLFFNASVQGTAALAEGLTGKHKYQAWNLAGGMMSLGYLLIQAAMSGADDGEDYEKLSEYTRMGRSRTSRRFRLRASSTRRRMCAKREGGSTS